MKPFCLFLLLCSLTTLAQTKTVKVVKEQTLNLDADQWIGFDKFGYQYAIKNSVLRKSQKAELFEYKNLSIGKITKVDIQKPMKIVVFFESFNAVVTLDNQLNETQRILFSDLPQPLLLVAMGFAAQNKLWGFDQMSQRLLLYDFIKNTPHFLGPPREEQMIYHQTTLNFFYWIDASHILYSCDIFGKTIRLGEVHSFEQCWILSKDQLLIYEKGQFYFQDIAQNLWIDLEIQEKNVENFTFRNGILSIFTNKQIFNHQIILP